MGCGASQPKASQPVTSNQKWKQPAAPPAPMPQSAGTARAGVAGENKGLARTNAIRPAESAPRAPQTAPQAASHAPATSQAPGGPSEAKGDEVVADLLEEGSGGAGANPRGSNADDLMNDFGLGGFDTADVRNFMLDGTFSDNVMQNALVGATALQGDLCSPRPVANVGGSLRTPSFEGKFADCMGAPTRGAEAKNDFFGRVPSAEIGRTSSFEGKFAERTPSDWDKSFKAEMEQALSGGGYGAGAGAGERAAEVESGNPPALASLIMSEGGADNAPPGKGPGAG